MPSEVAYHLTEHAPPAAAAVDTIGLDEFFQRVADRSGPGTDEPRAVFHARCVVEVLGEAVGQGLIGKLVLSLPEDWQRLFTAGSTGRMAGRDRT